MVFRIRIRISTENESVLQAITAAAIEEAHPSLEVLEEQVGGEEESLVSAAQIAAETSKGASPKALSAVAGIEALATMPWANQRLVAAFDAAARQGMQQPGTTAETGATATASPQTLQESPPVAPKEAVPSKDVSGDVPTAAAAVVLLPEAVLGGGESSQKVDAESSGPSPVTLSPTASAAAAAAAAMTASTPFGSEHAADASETASSPIAAVRAEAGAPSVIPPEDGAISDLLSSPTSKSPGWVEEAVKVSIEICCIASELKGVVHTRVHN